MNWWRKFWTTQPDDGAEAPASPPFPEIEPRPTAPVVFISDIHANLQALDAVLSDIKAQGIEDIVCLGDIVGYGGNPAECLGLIRAAGIPCVRGNHDAYAGSTDSFPQSRGEEFEKACRWMREQIGAESCSWLGNLPFTVFEEDFEAVHTSLAAPERWPYILTASDAEQHFARQTKRVSFAGHTHMPMMWVEGGEYPQVSALETLRENRKQLVNVGAVGQSRDGNPEACYVIYHRMQREVRWRRVKYDIMAAQKAIIRAGLPGRYAGRLEFGK